MAEGRNAVGSNGRGVDFDAVIVGAGFAGVYMLHRLRQAGLTARVFETGDGVGGTWYWNRYPGARCDIESLEYSYQFDEELQQEWEWSERYSPQAEILEYINHVTDRFGLRDGIQFETKVTQAHYDEEARCWRVETDRGDAVSARFCIMATGCLSSTNTPDYAGLDRFRGDWYHTGAWPHEGVDFTGKRVGIIGTGSSAIQSAPIIADEAEHLTVFQRTPNYSVPAHNGPIDPVRKKEVMADYPGFRKRNAETMFGADFHYNEAEALATSPEERQAEFERRWERGGLPFMAAFSDLLFTHEANQTVAEYLRGKIAEIVRDPEVAKKLSPDHVVGCKRLCVDTGYFDTFNRSNVSLVDVSETPVEEITETGLRTADAEYELDAIVFATGFDAMTGALLKVDIRGVDGETLHEKWAEGPRTYLGLATAGFPNLFTITGPGSPSVLSNMLPSIEQHVRWIGDCVSYMHHKGLTQIEAEPYAENAWVDHVNEVAGLTLYPSCNSWYLGSNIPGKKRVFMPYLGYAPYVAKCDEVAARDYEGFALSGA